MAALMGHQARAKDTKKTLKRLWGYLKRQGKKLALVFFLVLAGSLAGLAGPYLMGLSIDSIGLGAGSVDFKRLGIILPVMIGFYGVGALSTWLQNYIMAAMAQDTVRSLRKDLFDRMQALPVKFFDRYTHGELMSRLSNDIENVNNTLMQSVIQLFSSGIMLVGSLVMMLVLSPFLTVLSMVLIPLGMFVTRKIAAKTRTYFLSQQEILGELNGFIEESVSGQRVIKAFTREKKAVERFTGISENLRNIGIKAQIFAGIVPPTMNLINNLSFVMMAAVGGWMAAGGFITVGIIASFINYSRQFSRPVNEIANQFNLIQSAIAGAERVFEIMDEPPEVMGEEDHQVLEKVAGKVVFDSVTFGYNEGVPVLKNISIKANPGQTVALVGPTGAGKTTIVNLLMRFYDANSGRILIDGKDTTSLKKDSLRRSLGIVLQDTYLFSDTVRENIRYGRLDASDEEVEAAARLANADVFIERLPQGYDTVLTEEGANLSQGQRQLLTIARAILANPAILVLDEATSSVDTRTEMNIQKAMLSLMEGRTSFVIAHRLSTIRQADQILVINNGEIIERGTHEELMRAGGFYCELYNSQFRRKKVV